MLSDGKSGGGRGRSSPTSAHLLAESRFHATSAFIVGPTPARMELAPVSRVQFRGVRESMDVDAIPETPTHSELSPGGTRRLTADDIESHKLRTVPPTVYGGSEMGKFSLTYS